MQLPDHAWHADESVRTCVDQEHPGKCKDWSIACRVRIDWKFATLCKPGETMGDMPFALYGPDMYQVR